MELRIYPATRPADVYLFGTCLVDLFMPEAGLDAVKLIEREGVRVHFPRAQSCCGQPAWSSGNPDEAREVARAQLGLFGEPWPIVVPSGSCAGMMRHHWPELFDGDEKATQQACELAGRVYEFSEFLLHVLKVDFSAARDKSKSAGMGAEKTQPDERVALHTSCAARREMGTREHGVALVDALPGVTRVEHECEPECCGFGGTFALKHPDISGAMVGDKLAFIRASGCERLVSADSGCLLNIGHTAERQKVALPVEHIASFLWRRTGGDA